MERLIRNQIMEHMDKNKLFIDLQYGFRNKRSTVLQLLKVLDQWTEMLDEDNCLDVLYLDFSKAFDTVPHCRLMTKLQAYGICGKMLDWVKGTKIYSVVNNERDQNGLQDDITKMIAWSDKWQLSLNAHKCKVMHHGRPSTYNMSNNLFRPLKMTFRTIKPNQYNYSTLVPLYTKNKKVIRPFLRNQPLR